MLRGLRFVGRSQKGVIARPLVVSDDPDEVTPMLPGRPRVAASLKWQSLAFLLALGLSAACSSPECRARLHWQGRGETFRVYGCPAPDCVGRRLLSTVVAADACRGEDCEATVTTAEPWVAVAAVQVGGEALSASLPGCKSLRE